MPVEGFKGLVATDGSLPGKTRQVESMSLGSGAAGSEHQAKSGRC